MPTSLGHRHLDLMDQDCSTVMEAARHGRLRMTPARVLVLSLVGAAVQLGLAVVAFGGWTALSSHPALITLVLVTLGMIFVAAFSNVNLWGVRAGFILGATVYGCCPMGFARAV